MCFITLFFFFFFPPFSLPFFMSSFKFFPVFQFGQKLSPPRGGGDGQNIYSCKYVFRIFIGTYFLEAWFNSKELITVVVQGHKSMHYMCSYIEYCQSQTTWRNLGPKRYFNFVPPSFSQHARPSVPINTMTCQASEEDSILQDSDWSTRGARARAVYSER